MNLIITVIFTVLGFRFLGPRGAILGTFVGLLCDLVLTAYLKKRRIERTIGEQEKARSERLLLSCLSGICAQVASADGSFTAEEYEVFQSVLRDTLRMKRKHWKRSQLIFREALFSPQSFQMLAAQYYEMFRGQRIVLLNTIDLLFRLALADGKLDPREEKTIRDAAHIFALSQEEYYKYLNHYSPTFRENQATSSAPTVDPLTAAYKVLGASSQESLEEITRKYRKLMLEYHPDKIQSKELPDGFLRFANEKVLEVREAYELVNKARGK